MASVPIGPESSPVIDGRSGIPAVTQILSRYARPQLEAFLAVAIDLLDVLDGDADVEPNGDELDGSLAEDDFSPQRAGKTAGPGCPLSDPDLAIDDQGCDDVNDDREEEEVVIPSYAIDQSAGPKPFAISSERALLKPHLERIRRTRCDRIEYRGWNGGAGTVEYRLRDG